MVGRDYWFFRHTWQETIHEYIPSVPLMTVQYMTSGKDYVDESNVLIVSRDMLSRCIDKLVRRNFGVIILVSIKKNGLGKGEKKFGRIINEED